MKKTAILGGGVSGRAAERLCRILGWDSIILNDGETDRLPDCDLIVTSPGMRPEKSALYRQSLSAGKPFESELSLGFRHLGIPAVAVTGTNGKTTTTELTCALLNAVGVKAVACGNIGRPVSDVAAEMLESGRRLYDAAVIEVSSFQLERAVNFAPLAAALLNIEVDHLDRYHGSFDEYAAMKRSIFNLVKAENRIYGLSFSEQDATRRVTVDGGMLTIDGTPLLRLDETALSAPHNRENLAAAVELVLRAAPRPDLSRLAAAIKAFRPGAHRIEFVTKKNGVDFINDSKCTNPAAVLAAVRTVDTPIVILLGGLGKGMDFSALKEIVPKLRAAVVFGEARHEISALLKKSGMDAVIDAGTDFNAAFSSAVKAAEPGDTVLLSPACASMDMFKNYEERGDIFRMLARSL